MGSVDNAHGSRPTPHFGKTLTTSHHHQPPDDLSCPSFDKHIPSHSPRRLTGSSSWVWRLVSFNSTLSVPIGSGRRVPPHQPSPTQSSRSSDHPCPTQCTVRGYKRAGECRKTRGWRQVQAATCAKSATGRGQFGRVPTAPPRLTFTRDTPHVPQG